MNNASRTPIVHLSLAACLVVLSAASSRAQAFCAEGRAASGQCAVPALAEAARQAAIMFSQPKISTTAYPVLPSGDTTYRYPNQLTATPQKPSPTGLPAPN